MSNFVVYNPHNKPMEDLPIIYGFNNADIGRVFHGVLISEDGVFLGEHLSSDEGFMLIDLGLIEGYREDRHEIFKNHYPDGYRMEFVSYMKVENHIKLQKALSKLMNSLN